MILKKQYFCNLVLYVFFVDIYTFFEMCILALLLPFLNDSAPGVIYLKNMLTQFWNEKDPEHVTDVIPFNIHEQDRQPIRDNIIEAIIHAPEPVRFDKCLILLHTAF